MPKLLIQISDDENVAWATAELSEKDLSFTVAEFVQRFTTTATAVTLARLRDMRERKAS